MFNINDIYQNPYTNLYCCTCQCDTAAEAKEIAAKYVLSLHEAVGFTTELISQGNTVILTGPDRKALATAAILLNNSIYR